MCGDGDEAHCVVNGTDSFCSCRSGFQSNGRNRCEGAPPPPPRLPPQTNPDLTDPPAADKNECKQFGACSHICNNTKGSHKCSCHKHFTRINDTCKADGECKKSRSGPTFLPLHRFCFVFFSPAAAQRQLLYIADDNEIRSLDPSVPNWRYEQIFQGDANVRIDAMDVHVKTNRIYWTNWHTGRISSYDLPAASLSPNNRNRRQTNSRVTNVEVGRTGDGRVCVWAGEISRVLIGLRLGRFPI